MPDLSLSQRSDPRGDRVVLAPRVLLVESCEDDAVGVWDVLRTGWSAEVELLLVPTLAAALTALETHQVACVLLDLRLAGGDALEGLDRLRAAAPHIPVVVLAAPDDEARALQAVRAGAQDYLVKGRVDDALVARAVRYAVERQRSERALREQALHDPLTNLPNRQGFLERLRVMLAAPRLALGRTAVLFVALDRFTIVNESLGHVAGDRLLALVASRLRGVLREIDLVARFGGDEFTVLCDDVADEADALGVCDRIAEAIAAPFAIEGTEVFLTASVGIALAHPGASPAPEALVRDASAAARRSKALGAAHHTLFDEVMRTNARARLETENLLHRALERNELRIHYQPTYALRDGRINGFEALLRWEHPLRGLVPPAEFIPLAEETGLIEEIGAWVLDEACAQLARWHAMAPRSTRAPLAMSVNLSARQLQHPGLVETVAASVARAGVPAHALVLELTESLVVCDEPSTRAIFTALRGLGVRLAIDDFGTGYASLAALKRFPADVVKIDRSFVSGVGIDPVDTSIVSAVIGLTHELGLLSVAEGVERVEQVDALRELGCDIVQGFLYARPAPAREIDLLLRA